MVCLIFDTILKRDLLMKVLEPMGKPNMTIPSVVSLPRVKVARHSVSIIFVEGGRYRIGNELLVDASKGTTALRSSTKASRLVMPPSLSSKGIWLCFLVAARARRRMSRSDMIMLSTNAARIALRGQP